MPVALSFAAPLELGVLLSGPAIHGTMRSGVWPSRYTREQRAANSQELVDGALKTVRRMKRDARAKRLLQQAKGVFIIPDFGRGPWDLGDREGVLLIRRGERWTDPAFYEIGEMNAGSEPGASGRRIAILLMGSRAVSRFRSRGSFSLQVNAGLTVTARSAKGRSFADHSDLIAWCDVKDLPACVPATVNGITYEPFANAAYYEEKVSARDIRDGKARRAGAFALVRSLPAVG